MSQTQFDIMDGSSEAIVAIDKMARILDAQVEVIAALDEALRKLSPAQLTVAATNREGCSLIQSSERYSESVGRASIVMIRLRVLVGKGVANGV